MENKGIFMEKRFKGILLISILWLFLLIPRYSAECMTVKAVDFFTGEPIGDAVVTSNNGFVPTDEPSNFVIPTKGNKLRVRAHGYRITEQVITAPVIPMPHVVKMVPFTPKALYLTVYAIGERSLRESALKLIQETELNALVIDMKGDRGMIPYKSSIPLASEVGAQRIITVKNMGAMVKSLKERGIYTIARIVVFKDNPLALTKPDWAVKNPKGEIWRDRENLAWVDPFKKEIWDYNINIAVEAAQQGFDEIQFDYVRFPDASAPRFSLPNTEENRVKAVSEFLKEAKRRLLPYNVFISADIFGYVCWNLNDTFIGQRLDALAPYLDYLSPMLYPSGFQFGIPGYRKPLENPHEIVYRTLKRAQERTHLKPIRFRPWLQAFRDYSFDRRHFNGKEIRDQINASEKFGSQGWMLWNPRNIYSSDGLKKRDAATVTTGLVPNPKT
jgi:hypothetical protein